MKTLEVKVDWVNDGNGYTYFIWKGMESRAGFIGDLKEFEGKTVVIKFNYSLETYADFANHQLPTIISME